MATMGDPHAGGEPAAAYTFKGHPQPPPDERLQECKNYLADEDVNHNLDFKSKLSQIEDYIKDLGEKQIACDSKLLRDVKTMATVQREWLDIMDAPPCDKNPCKPDQYPPISDRLVSKEVRRELQDEKEAMGLANQTREDHAPFTVERNDQKAFLMKLKEDQSENPETVEEATNLLWVENRAYGWALREPSLIPVWLHPRLGLSNKGIKASDGDPWYRKAVRPSGIKRRPPSQKLPDYLQHAQDTVNALLQKFAKGLATDDQIKQLEDYLSDFELISLKRLRKDRERIREHHPEWRDVEIENLNELEREIGQAHKVWLSSFAQDGIQFVVGEKPATYILQPGVFYVPGAQPSAHDLDRLERIEARANYLLQMTPEELEVNDDARRELASYLEPIFLPEMRRIEDESAKLVAPVNTAENITKHKLDDDFDNAAIDLLEPLLGTTVQFRYQRPGEIATPAPNLVYFPWSPDSPLLQYASPLPKPDESLSELEDKIRNSLEGLSRYPGNLSKTQITQVERELEKVMYPALRKKRDLYLEARAQRSGRKADAEERDLKFDYDATCQAWVNSFLDAHSIEIRMASPNGPDGRPGVLYNRAPAANLDMVDVRRDLKNLADNINNELQSTAQLQENPEEQDLYRLLANLQYPQLKWLDEHRRQLSSQVAPTEDEIRTEQEMHKHWRKMYSAWVASFQGANVVVRLSINNRDFKLGDPSLLYYRGALGRHILPETPESPGEKQDPPLTQRKIDHTLFMLYWHRALAEDKLALAARLEAVSCLPPSVVGRLDEYRRARASKVASNEVIHAKEQAAISAFSLWEKKIRSEARSSPARPTGPGLPDWVQDEEDTINQLLEVEHPIGEDLDRLNALIEPYWERQLIELRNWRMSRLRSNGVPEEEIDLVDMSISTFPVELQEFKAKCRARGFKIIVVEDHPDHFSFQAQDPDLPSFTSEPAQEMVECLTDLNVSGYYPSPPDSMLTNEIWDETLEREQEINYLLSIHNRARGDANHSVESRVRSVEELGRLQFLLTPFFPRNIAIAWRQFMASINSDLLSTKGEQEVNPAAERFASIYEPWVRRLEATKVRLASGSIDDNLEDNVDGILYYEYKPPASNQTLVEEDNTTRHLSPEFRKVQDEINDLLNFRRSRALTLAEEKRLRCLLRVVMPIGLAANDDSFRLLSQQVRAGHLDPELVLEYEHESDYWRKQYYSWLDSFAEKGVRLQEPVPGEPFSPKLKSNIMVIQVETPDEIPDDSTEIASLPFHIRARQDLLNRYLRGDVDLTSEETDECVQHLKSWWSPQGDNIRLQVYDQYCNEENVTPDSMSPLDETRLEAVVYDVTQKSFFSFLQRLHSIPQAYGFKIVETQPENFKIILLPIKKEIAIEDKEVLKDFISNTMMTTRTQNRVSEVMNLARREFLSLASKVQDLRSSFAAPSLTNEERKQAETLLQPLSRDEFFSLERDIKDLMSDPTARLSRIDQERLQDLRVKQMWYWWGNKNPEIRDLLLDIVNQPDQVWHLLNPVSFGGTKDSQPAMDPPTQAEMDAVIDKVNTLLEDFKRGTLQEPELEHLKYILRAFVPFSMKKMERHMADLQESVESSKGITDTESLKLAEFRTQFPRMFQKWMNSISSLDDLLNKWWLDFKVMREFYIRAQLWKKAIIEVDEGRSSRSTSGDKDDGRFVENDLVTPPTTALLPPAESLKQPRSASIIKNDALRDHQENREILMLFTKNYEGNYHDRLLLDHMDAPLTELYEQIQGLRDRERSAPLTFDESQRLRIVTEDFVRDHMIWYSSLTLEQVKIFRDQAVDFSAKAERRGVERAAVELALNLLATNQEQHRPHDRFRRVPLPPKYQPPSEEFTLWKPLDPWNRPVELDPFYYTNLMQKFRRWKDSDYSKARNQTINEQPGQLQPPINYNGPFTLQTLYDLQKIARKRHNLLTQISMQLVSTYENAPRPLLERICALIGEAIHNDTGQPRPIQDKIPLTMSDLDLLNELCEPSWSLDERQPYSDYPAGLPREESALSLEKAKLEEFERDVMSARKADNDPRSLVPFWVPGPRQTADPGTDAYFIQRYDKNIISQDSIALGGSGGLIERINEERCARASRVNGSQDPHMWKVAEVQHFLQVMHDAGRIHLDKVNQRVSRVPPSGHPENKYVFSEQDAKNARYIIFNNDTKKYEMRLDNYGNWGHPIVQPNKYRHFQQIASRLGRDIRQLSELIATSNENDDATRLQQQFDALQGALRHMDEIKAEHVTGAANGKKISLKMIARDLLKYAPELLQDIGLDRNHDVSTITEDQAAQAIQLQLIEESNNNWEPRFPENEHVWDWFDDQVPIVQTPVGTTSTVASHDASNSTTPLQPPPANKYYFSLRRWPVECQSTAVQTKIKTSGPTLEMMVDTTETKTMPEAPKLAAARRRARALGPCSRERHIGTDGPPNFPFGETPFQQAYQSFRIEQDFEDVPEFSEYPPPDDLFSRLKRKVAKYEAQRKAKHEAQREGEREEERESSHPDVFALPKIPSEWNPTNVSVTEKRDDLIKKAKGTHGFPTTDDAYSSPAEIALKKRREAILEDVQARERAKAMIVERAGKPLGQIQEPELRKIQDELNIDPIAERVRPPPKAAKKPKKKPAVDPTMMTGGVGQGDTAATTSGPDRVQDIDTQASPAEDLISRAPKAPQPTTTTKPKKRTATEEAGTSGTLPSLRRKRRRVQAFVEDATE